MKCPTPDKNRHRSRLTAMKQATASADWYGQAMRVYRCPCGGWHVTTKKNGPGWVVHPKEAK